MIFLITLLEYTMNSPGKDDEKTLFEVNKREDLSPCPLVADLKDSCALQDPCIELTPLDIYLNGEKLFSANVTGITEKLNHIICSLRKMGNSTHKMEDKSTQTEPFSYRRICLHCSEKLEDEGN